MELCRAVLIIPIAQRERSNISADRHGQTGGGQCRGISDTKFLLFNFIKEGNVRWARPYLWAILHTRPDLPTIQGIKLKWSEKSTKTGQHTQLARNRLSKRINMEFNERSGEQEMPWMSRVLWLPRTLGRGSHTTSRSNMGRLRFWGVKVDWIFHTPFGDDREVRGHTQLDSSTWYLKVILGRKPFKSSWIMSGITSIRMNRTRGTFQ